MSDNNSVLFIINKFSGTRYSPALEGAIIDHCAKRNLECTIEFTREPGHGVLIARKAAERKFKMVFAVGGDGTVNEVAQGLLHGSIPLGIIPKGSGNGLARHLQIPMKIDHALSLLDCERVVYIDTFSINDRPSINVSGIGFDGLIAGMFGKDGKRGLLRYGKLVVSHFRKFQNFECQITLDGKKTTSFPFIVSIANSSQFGNNATISPYASLCDQRLDICLVRKMNVVQGLVFAHKLFNKTLHQSDYISIQNARQVELVTREPIPYHIDGEAAGSDTHFKVNINAASLPVIVPNRSVLI